MTPVYPRRRQTCPQGSPGRGKSEGESPEGLPPTLRHSSALVRAASSNSDVPAPCPRLHAPPCDVRPSRAEVEGDKDDLCARAFPNARSTLPAVRRCPLHPRWPPPATTLHLRVAPAAVVCGIVHRPGPLSTPSTTRATPPTSTDERTAHGRWHTDERGSVLATCRLPIGRRTCQARHRMRTGRPATNWPLAPATHWSHLAIRRTRASPAGRRLPAAAHRTRATERARVMPPSAQLAPATRPSPPVARVPPAYAHPRTRPVRATRHSPVPTRNVLRDSPAPRIPLTSGQPAYAHTYSNTIFPVDVLLIYAAVFSTD
ncbi:hypothetical protein GGX14DRAFT_619490 [Mycena pura]|uniref:Uncharacterized protein n=1 Tax=Mycena pura TaxID=153505 RepID=A0AAD6YD77_9AGAR|nr:hypothetical protein GGX14DRAFT_619490 [Mycena pura]